MKEEVDTLNKNVTKENKHKIKVKEWIKDIDNKVNTIVNKQKTLSNIYKITLDRNSLFYYYCSITTKIINWKSFRHIRND